MSNFLKLLIYHIDSLNGQRNSSTNLQKYLVQKHLKKKDKNAGAVGLICKSETEDQIKKRIAHQTMLNVFSKYSVMRSRMKLSFCCFTKGATLTEIWLSQISKSFALFVDTGQIPLEQNSATEKLVNNIMSLSVKDTLNKIIRSHLEIE